MAVEVKKITTADFDHIYPLLTEFKNVTGISRERWKLIFNKNWQGGENYFGYYLSDNKKTVGLLGMIFSERQIGGITSQFCDLAAWYVRPEYRGYSISLLLPVLGRKDLTITTFTASNRVISVLKKISFRDVESFLRIAPPIQIHHTNTRVIFDHKEIEMNLAGQELQTFQDHANLDCIHLGIFTVSGFCHLMINKVFRKKLSIAHVDYASNRQIVIDNANFVAWQLYRRFKFLGVEIGGHMIEDRNPKVSIKIKRNHPILFRSNTVKPSDIDIIYSEIQLLGLYPT